MNGTGTGVWGKFNLKVPKKKIAKSELQIRGDTEDYSKIIFLISQQKRVVTFH